MPTEAFVQLPPDSTGKPIRLLQVVLLQPDGTWETEYQEVVTLADEDGHALATGGYGYKAVTISSPEILDRLDAVCSLLTALLEVMVTVGRPKRELRAVSHAMTMIETGKAA